MSALCLANHLATVQSPFGSFPWKSYQIKSRGYALTCSTLLRFFALTTIVGSILILKSYSLVFSIPITSWFPYSRRRISVWQISLRTRYFSISNLFTLQAYQSCITSVLKRTTPSCQPTSECIDEINLSLRFVRRSCDPASQAYRTRVHWLVRAPLNVRTSSVTQPAKLYCTSARVCIWSVRAPLDKDRNCFRFEFS